MSTVLIVGGGVLNKYKITALHVLQYSAHKALSLFLRGRTTGGGEVSYKTIFTKILLVVKKNHWPIRFILEHGIYEYNGGWGWVENILC